MNGMFIPTQLHNNWMDLEFEIQRGDSLYLSLAQIFFYPEKNDN